MSVYDKATEEWFSKRPGQESTVEQCDQCGLYYKPSLGHKCKVKAGEKAMTIEEAIAMAQIPLGCEQADEKTKEFARVCISALEKQMPREPKKSENESLQEVVTNFCPICGVVISKSFDRRYCGNCGQAIDWGEINDD